MIAAPSPAHRVLSRAVMLYLLAGVIGLHLLIAWPAVRSTVLGLLGGAGAALVGCYLIIVVPARSARTAQRRH